MVSLSSTTFETKCLKEKDISFLTHNLLATRRYLVHRTSSSPLSKHASISVSNLESGRSHPISRNCRPAEEEEEEEEDARLYPESQFESSVTRMRGVSSEEQPTWEEEGEDLIHQRVVQYTSGSYINILFHDIFRLYNDREVDHNKKQDTKQTTRTVTASFVASAYLKQHTTL